MSDPFTDYAKTAHSRVSRPQKLIGPTKTRANALNRYTDIVAEIRACEDVEQLEIYLIAINPDIAQFKAELSYLWEGDGEDFIGLSGEIEKRREELRALPDGEPERIFGW